MKKYYLAYGSNLHLVQMGLRCKKSTVVGTTVLKNYRLVYRGSCDEYAYLTIERFEGGYVPVGIYEISFLDELALNQYEGYPYIYHKEYFTVNVNGRGEEALIYVMNEYFDYHIPSIGYVRTCVQGYEDFGFDQSLLSQAYQYSVKERNKVLKKSKSCDGAL